MESFAISLHVGQGIFSKCNGAALVIHRSTVCLIAVLVATKELASTSDFKMRASLESRKSVAIGTFTETNFCNVLK